MTINDLLLAVLSKSLNDYLREHTNDKKTKFIRLACPYSLRAPPKFLGDFKFENNFSTLNLNMRLIDSFETGIKQLQRDMNALKTSMDPLSTNYMNILVSWMPEIISNFVMEDYADKMTFGFSNVPGPRIPYLYGGL